MFVRFPKLKFPVDSLLFKHGSRIFRTRGGAVEGNLVWYAAGRSPLRFGWWFHFFVSRIMFGDDYLIVSNCVFSWDTARVVFFLMCSMLVWDAIAAIRYVTRNTFPGRAPTRWDSARVFIRCHSLERIGFLSQFPGVPPGVSLQSIRPATPATAPSCGSAKRGGSRRMGVNLEPQKWDEEQCDLGIRGG